MKKIFCYFKGMSVEDALFFSVMMGVALIAFAFAGGVLRMLDAGLATWLIYVGLFIGLVGNIAVFVKNDFFIHDITVKK